MVKREFGNLRLEYDGQEYAAFARDKVILRGPRLAPVELALARAWQASALCKLETADLFT